MEISAIIPTYNRVSLLRRTLPTILNQEFPAQQCEIILVVDGSSDGTADFLRGLRSECSLRIIEQPHLGRAAACNVGIRSARGKLVLLLDDDLLCSPQLLKDHVAAHTGAAPSVVFGPVLIDASSPPSLVADLQRRSCERWLNRLQQQGRTKWPDDAILFSNSSVPTKVLIDCGGFDETYIRSHEEVDMGLRLWGQGLQFRFKPTAVVREVYVKSVRQFLSDAEFYGKNEVRLSRKHPAWRPYTDISALSQDGCFKRIIRRVLIRVPWPAEAILALATAVCQRLRFISAIRRLGLRALAWRRQLRQLRAAAQEAGSCSKLYREFAAHLPVLLYHRVGRPLAGEYPGLTIFPEQFEKQMHALYRLNRHPISFSEWKQWLDNGKSLPRNPIVLTFDDGYADLAENVFPVLRRWGFPATVFLVSSQIGGTNAWDEASGLPSHRLLGADQVGYWSQQGIEFGAHTRTHPDLRTIAPNAVAEEVAGSRSDLERLLRQPVHAFAYPGGEYNDAITQTVAVNFPVAVTTDEGLNTLRTEPALLRRTPVPRQEALFGFMLRIYFGYNPASRLRARLRLRSRLRRLLNARVNVICGMEERKEP